MRLLSSLFFLSVLSILSAGLPVAHAAERNDTIYDVRLRGVTVGVLHLSVQQDTAAYAVEATVKDAGLMNVFRPISYLGTARGTLRDGLPQPVHFTELADTGRRQSQAALDYDGGRPRVTDYTSSNPPGPDTPDPTTQGDTVDPATALFAIFRDQPADAACNRRILIYDGMRRSHVALETLRREGDLLRCNGEYRRLQGFTPKELARNVAFPLEMTLAPVGAGMVRVVQVKLASSYGLATLDRR